MVLSAVALAAAAFLLLRSDGKSSESAPASEVVKRGDVRATVAGVGTLQAAKSVSLGFGAGGRVSSVDVHLGQKVKTGQVLARLDDALPRTTLRAAEGQVAAAEAKLTQVVEGHTPQEFHKVSTANSAAERAVTGASRTAAKARKVAVAEVATLRGNVRQAQKNHVIAVKRLSQSRIRMGSKESRAMTTKAAYEQAKEGVAQARAQIVALAGTREANRKKGEEEEKKEREKAEAEEKKEREKAEAEETLEREVAEAEGKEFKGGKEFKAKEITVTARNTETGTGAAEAQASSQLEEAQSILTEAQTLYERFRTEADTLRASLPELRSTVRSTAEAVATARGALRSGQATSAQTLRTALETAETARSTLQTTVSAGEAEIQPSKTGEMGEALAAVSQAEATVATAEKGLEETVLRAPTAGRVANLKVAVGDVVSGGSTSSTSATSGTSSSGESSESSSSTGEASSSGTSSGSSSSSPSIVLTSPRLKVFDVLLTQADAVKVKSGDPATLVIDALDRTVKGHLVSITPLPQVKNGVVNYTAAVATTRLPKKLRIGMTAEVTLQTASRHNVAMLSRSALSASTGTVQVEVLDHGKRESRTVSLGILGDEDVEVKSGLKPGERVLLPSQPEIAGGEEESGGEEFGGEEFGGGE